MTIKRVMLIILCALLMAMGSGARAQRANTKASPAKTRMHARKTRQQKASQPRGVQVLFPLEDKFVDNEVIKGEIISVDGNNFTIRDEHGLDTVVVLFPDTVYQIETSSGAVRRSEPKIILTGLKVVVDGLLNSSYRMRARVIRTKESDLIAAQALRAIQQRF